MHKKLEEIEIQYFESVALAPPVSACAAIAGASNLIYTHKELLAPQKNTNKNKTGQRSS